MNSMKDFANYFSNLSVVDCADIKDKDSLKKIKKDDKIVLCDKTIKNVSLKPVSLSKT